MRIITYVFIYREQNIAKRINFEIAQPINGELSGKIKETMSSKENRYYKYSCCFLDNQHSYIKNILDEYLQFICKTNCVLKLFPYAGNVLIR